LVHCPRSQQLKKINAFVEHIVA
jgi:hypothetical protein